jgi:hypothetical protein
MTYRQHMCGRRQPAYNRRTIAQKDDPSVYAKRSFPMSIINTRQTPRRVVQYQTQTVLVNTVIRGTQVDRGICSREYPIDQAAHKQCCHAATIMVQRHQNTRCAQVSPSISLLWSSNCSSLSRLKLIAKQLPHRHRQCVIMPASSTYNDTNF